MDNTVPSTGAIPNPFTEHIMLPVEIGDDGEHIETENLSNLYIFNCSNNNTTEIPREIGNLIDLRQFNCTNNNTTEIPIEICNLINLRHYPELEQELAQVQERREVP